ncbi:VIT domain-containing protein [Saccharothrix syringae]|uniref:VWA domain-containing protein n=1 Tax=Saccharothrix syringae TaxID=103733 RepID=A0A5Q0H5X8_SACSY|nr:VIT domain-containing protein [Saccharothrix syringae]QFZ21621.1 VWA domain-containing protein [Saccharothrix syringae]
MSTTIDVIETPGATTLPAEPAEDAGLGCLRTERGNLPLEAVDVHATITGLASRTTLTQVFRNPHAEPLEATYVFPLPARAAVTGLRVEADGRVVEGVLKERGEARADYDQAISGGKRAAIAEEERPGVFTTRVGNLVPGEQVTVRLTLVGVLAYEDDAAEYRLPLVVAPRYIPGTPLAGGQVGDGVAQDTDAVPDASRISPPVLLPGFPDPVRLSVVVDVEPAGLPVARPASSLHATVTEETATGFRVRVEPGARVDRDFLLRLRFADAGAVRTSLAVRPDEEGTGGTFALTVLPPEPTGPVRGRDVVLVLDRSGSMGGWKVVAARRAASRVVDSLTTGDRFAVLAFDDRLDSPDTLPAGLVEATDRNRYRAVEFLAGLGARGSTEMLAPLRRAAELLGANGERERVLVLVTDGQVGDEDRLLREVATGLAGVRVHTVGIDRAVNAAFLQRLAGSTGRCELVESEDRLDEAMRHIHHRIGAPVLTGLAVHAAGLAITEQTLAPTPLPDLFTGAPVLITGRYAGEPTGEVEITGDNGWRHRLPATPSDNVGLAALWARARVRDLEDRYVVGAGNPTDLERRIVDTSLRFGVLSRFTAFVAVDERVVNESGTVRRVTQPVELPDGWVHQAPDTAFGGSYAPAPAAAGFAGAMPAAAMPFAAPPAGAPAPAPRMRKLSAARSPELGRTGMPQRLGDGVGRRGGQAPNAPAPAGGGGGRGGQVPNAPAPSVGLPQVPGVVGRPQAPKPDVAPPTPDLAAFLSTELAGLRATRTPEAQVPLLVHLHEAITRHLSAWEAAGAPAETVRRLTELAAELAGPATVEQRFQRAVEILAELTEPRRRKPFWKR